MKLNYSLDDMHLFWLVARYGSFRQAAQQAGLPASTLSRRIKRLEQQLALRLLHRDAHRVTLTASGQQYLQRCGPLFGELTDISSELYHEVHGARGTIRIAAPVNSTQHWLGRALNRFLQRYPDIDIQLTLSNSNIDMNAQLIDMVFRVGDLPPSDWIARPLLQVPFMLYASQQQAAWLRLTHPSELAQVPLVVSTPITHWRLQHKHTQAHYLWVPQPAAIRLAVNDISVASQAVADGIGVGFLPLSMTTALRDSGELQAIMSDWIGQPRLIHMLYRDRDNLPQRVRLLIDFMLAYTRELG
ncbi:LysR family transcriptional regulator [Idiomarina xiamenensis]|uniref:LysR family transcriptional regulator n=1 Tax=Idiomarina xiamenensis 10-D-4 TaxID=740709 RepID=K2JBK8_9GAMM|nr:LysR family transcriptional regulator [Idiomarina xiamenensis]EKE80631.1 LysR family transcriptional regulator [Idiomarina xiamenensis 10-D-4]